MNTGEQEEAERVQTHEIRKRFLDHFVKAGHTEVPSASVILDDPNLLFVNAGMVQFVPFFLGQRTPPYATATSIQKCIRTPDIDEVGITTRHNTFFQMAGNFSFGDYFKREAIALAWDLLTNSVSEGGYGLNPEKLWATVYLDDDEAAQLWREIANLPTERIQRRGMADNYWSMGIPGPCGPSSEIYYDRGPEFGVEGGPVVNEDRYIEIWNLVFMQNERGEGTRRKTSKSWGRCRARTSTPAWVWSESRSSCRACTTCTKPTCCDRLSTLSPLVHPAATTPATTKTMCATASSPTTAAPRRS